MSRSNTRNRRAQWKATVPTLVTCDRCRSENFLTLHAQHVVHTQNVKLQIHK